MRCARPPRGRGAASQSWSAMQSAKSCSNHGLQVRLLSGTASQSVRPSTTIASTISPDAARGSAVFVDSGAWIALALSRDPLHVQAREQWELLYGAGAKLHTSVPVVIETFTFLDRNANRDVALTWKEAIYRPDTVKLLPCELRDLEQSWEYFRRGDRTNCRRSMPPALRA
jgi:predicted nucleic acid-binding protein